MISVNNAIMPWQCLFALLVNTMISLRVSYKSLEVIYTFFFKLDRSKIIGKMFNAMKLSSLQKDKVTPKIYY